MSRPRFFSVPADVADTLVRRDLRRHWTEGGMVRVLLSSSDLYPYGIDRALAEGAVELSLEQVKRISIQ